MKLTVVTAKQSISVNLNSLYNCVQMNAISKFTIDLSYLPISHPLILTNGKWIRVV